MLITADWVLPVAQPPVREGAVLLERGHVVAVGSAEHLAPLNTDGTLFEFPGCVVSPGLVNAHTHLSLSAFEGLLDPAPFGEWLPRLVRGMRSWDNDDFAASAALGARRCLESGVTTVADIVYGPESAAAAADAGLAGVFYWEVLGIEASRLYQELERMEYPLLDAECCSDRILCGLSPHSAYTSGPELLVAIQKASVRLGVPVAIHVAESAAEVELMVAGSGPLAHTAARIAHGFEVPGVNPIAYLDRLGALSGATAVHVGEASPGDIVRLASSVRGVVTCPRSNAFLSNEVAPVDRLLHAGIAVGIGTDSAASNHDLDLMSELRSLRTMHPSIDDRTLIRMATQLGAIAVGLDDHFGVLERGAPADIAVFDLGDTSLPEAAFVDGAGSDTVRAVMTCGVWRVLDGRMVNTGAEIVAAERATEKARAAISEA